MELAIVDSDIMYISPEDWLVVERRDNFLNRFTEIIDAIDEDSLFELAWSSDIDEIIFSDMNPPWVIDGDWANKILPIYYTLTKRAKYFDVSTTDPMTLSPSFNCKYPAFGDVALKIIHKAIDDWPIAFIIDPLRLLDFRVACTCHSYSYSFRCIRDLSALDAERKVKDICSFRAVTSQELVDVVLACLRLWSEGVAPVTTFIFLDSFVRDFSSIVSENERLSIIKSLAKRVTLTRLEAVRHAGLHDEPIDNERRFRINSSRRVHYIESNVGISFKVYYSGSEHDDAL